MQPLSPSEARLLHRLENGFGWRLFAGPVVGALGGLVFAWVMLASTTGGRFTLGDTSPAYARLEAAVGPFAAFVLLCMAAFGGLGVFVSVVVIGALRRQRHALRARADWAADPNAPPAPPEVPVSPLRSRGLGALLLAIGAALGYFTVLAPLRAAAAGAATVSLSMKGAIVVPILLGVGLVTLLLGPRADAMLGTRRAGRGPTPLGWVLLVVLLAAGIGLYFWMEGRLRAQGYVFQ